MNFLTFLNKLKTPDNKTLIESIKKGYIACFESVVEYFGEDYFTGKRKEYFADSIPLETFDKEEVLRQVIENWKKKSSLSQRELEFILSKRPKIIFLGNTISLVNHPAWNTIRKKANLFFKDEIEELKQSRGKEREMYMQRKLRQNKKQASLSKIKKHLSTQDKIKQEKMERLTRGLQQAYAQES